MHTSRTWARILRRARLFVPMIFILAGCATQPVVSAIGPGGMLEVFTPDARFAKSIDSGHWSVLEDPAPGALIITTHGGLPALKIEPLFDAFVIARPLDANLLATPYLEWSWNMSEHAPPYHDVTLLVGFAAPPGAPEQPWSSAIPQINGAPQASRALQLGWTYSALARGYLDTTGEHTPLPLYAVRGGTENTARWWRESIDLAALYTQLWPMENPANVKIAYIAITAHGARDATVGYLSTITLFR